jgi:hypothetical protein
MGWVGGRLVGDLDTLRGRKELFQLFHEGCEGVGEAVLIKQDQMAVSL